MAELIPREVLDLIPARVAERHSIVPLGLTDGVLRVAHPSGLDAGVLRELALLLDVEIHGEERAPDVLAAMIRAHYGLGAQTIESLVRAAGSPAVERRPGELTQDLHGLSDDATIVAFVNRLIQQSCEDGATDIHIEPYENRLRVRCRIDGLLHDVPVPPGVHRFHSTIISRLKVMAHLDIAERRLPQDGRFRARIHGAELDFRVSIVPTPYGEAVDIRVLANASILRGLESLGMQAADLQIVRDVLAKPHGVVLVTGPTGSGKTTTLYSFLNRLNETHRKIITIEDPIEYNLEGVTQIQVRPKIGLTFASGLRSMLRHDPDVMMVGEIRDRETAETVIRVALTGHLVFSTVHTNDAPSTPARLMDMGMEPYLAASSIECVIAQRLIRLVCSNCAAASPDTHDAASLGISVGGYEQVFGSHPGELRTARGCDRCHFTGYRGRTGIFEILPVTPVIRDLVMQRQSADRLGRGARAAGGWPRRWKGLQVAVEGRTSIEEVLRVTAAQEGA
ncbi:MAG: GspE/PulE family protein [Candidatus Krumholzibacteriia bacterium]